MKHRFILYRRKRGGVFYLEDTQSKKQESLHTKNRAEALTLLHCKNEAHRQPVLNLQIARTYLSAADPEVTRRTWQRVMDEIIRTKTGENRGRWMVVAKSKKYDAIRARLLIETQAEHLLQVLQQGTVSTNVYLRRKHNFALDMNWLPASVIPRRQWPPSSARPINSTGWA